MGENPDNAKVLLVSYVSNHLENDQIDGEGIELLRAMFKKDAAEGEPRACTIMALCNHVERLMTENVRLRNHMEGVKGIDWESLVRRSQ